MLSALKLHTPYTTASCDYVRMCVRVVCSDSRIQSAPLPRSLSCLRCPLLLLLLLKILCNFIQNIFVENYFRPANNG